MGTVKTLIERSLRSLIVLSEGEEATADMINDGLVVLIDMLNTWAIEGMMVPYQITESFTLSTTLSSYSWKPGGNFNSASPNRVNNASFQYSTYQNPLDRMDRRQYMALPNTAVVSEPKFFMFEWGATFPTFYLNCLPYAGLVKVTSEKPFDTSFVLTDTTVFPSSYDRALRTNLAIDLAPEYSKSVPKELADVARSSKGAIERFNSQPVPSMKLSVPGQKFGPVLPFKTS